MKQLSIFIHFEKEKAKKHTKMLSKMYYMNADAFKKTASGFNYLVGFLLFLV